MESPLSKLLCPRRLEIRFKKPLRSTTKRSRTTESPRIDQSGGIRKATRRTSWPRMEKPELSRFRRGSAPSPDPEEIFVIGCRYDPSNGLRKLYGRRVSQKRALLDHLLQRVKLVEEDGFTPLPSPEGYCYPEVLKLKNTQPVLPAPNLECHLRETVPCSSTGMSTGIFLPIRLPGLSKSALPTSRLTDALCQATQSLSLGSCCLTLHTLPGNLLTFNSNCPENRIRNPPFDFRSHIRQGCKRSVD
jgi:hypothetical protein